MRLINVNSYQLSHFFSDELPKYAILSHTWGIEEVSLQNMLCFDNSRGTQDVESMLGFQKIKYTCDQAVRDGLEWAWVDTCCIDQTSSAELTEAINSMYNWYERAEICYAYFVDVPQDSDITAPNSAFRNSRWFTRGWTLQELVAPVRLDAYSKDWTSIGRIRPTLEGQAFAILLEEITGVSRYCLLKWRAPGTYSVAHRFSWAAKRRCTRIEDQAYCLMGIFDVNMPLLYGEGKKAFIRLQEEILKAIDDHSILAWTVSPSDPRAGTVGSVLAESPADFAKSALVYSLHEEVGSLSVMTKKGLQMDLHVAKLDKLGAMKQESSVMLNCTKSGAAGQIVMLVVQPFVTDNKNLNSTYCRYITQEHQYSSVWGSLRTIYIRKQVPAPELESYMSLGSLYVHHLPTNISTERSMCPTDRRGYRITGVDTGTLPDWNAEAIQVKHPSPDRVSLHAFLIESNHSGDMEPFVFLCGIKRDTKFFAPRAVFCLLIKSTQSIDDYIRDVAESRMEPPWVPVQNKGLLTSTILSISSIWVRVELHVEDGIRNGSSIGLKRTYRANFSFGNYDMVVRMNEKQKQLALVDPQKPKVGMLDAYEQKEILARIVARRTHGRGPPFGMGSFGLGSGYNGLRGGFGAIMGPEFSKFR